MQNNLSDIQKFVAKKCGGMSLQHILRSLSFLDGSFGNDANYNVELYENNLWFRSYNPANPKLEIEIVLFDDHSNIASFKSQSKATQMAIAKLLGYKEGEKNAK